MLKIDKSPQTELLVLYSSNKQTRPFKVHPDGAKKRYFPLQFLVSDK